MPCFPDHEPNINLESMHDMKIFAQSGKPVDVEEKEDLGNLVDLQQVTIARLQQEMYVMSNCMLEKDKTISTLQFELANLSCNHEIQLEQQIWLNSEVNDHEDITKKQEKVIRALRESLDVEESNYFNKELEITALESTLSDKSSLCEEQASTIASLEKKA